MSKKYCEKKDNRQTADAGDFHIPGYQLFVVFYAPVDLYCANVSEFWFDFSTLLITALGMFAACFAVLMVLYLIAMLIHPYVPDPHWLEG